MCSTISANVVMPTSTMPVTAMSYSHSGLPPQVSLIIIAVASSTGGATNCGSKSSSLTGLVNPCSMIISELLSSTLPIMLRTVDQINILFLDPSRNHTSEIIYCSQLIL